MSWEDAQRGIWCRSRIPLFDLPMLDFDELNRLTRSIYLRYAKGEATVDDVIDDFFDFLVDVYLLGVEDTEDMLNAEIKADVKEAADSIYKRVKGKNFKDRIKGYTKPADADIVNISLVNELQRLAETEAHRVYNEAILNSGRKAKAKFKQWRTMKDDKVRDTHQYLEGMKIPFENKFYTYDNDSAMCPGGFTKAQNNVNCRCYIYLSAQ